MIVSAYPLTLCIVIALFPVAMGEYTPLVTSTRSLASEAVTASWRFVYGLDQSVPLPAVGKFALTYMVFPHDVAIPRKVAKTVKSASGLFILILFMLWFFVVPV